jgi:uncharacterized protein YndB with AHSA1/START domain
MSRDILHAITIGAGAGTVYNAISTAEGLSSFWTSDSRAEPEEGSEARFGFRGAELGLRMHVDRLRPGALVEWTCAGDFPHWEGSTVTWELGEGGDGAGTHLIFRHSGLSDAQPDAEFGSVNHTWGTILDALKAYAETGRPGPALR